jgi:hypothetical protein
MRILSNLRVLVLGLASTTALLAQIDARDGVWLPERLQVFASALAYPLEARDALNARLNRLAKVIVP